MAHETIPGGFGDDIGMITVHPAQDEQGGYVASQRGRSVRGSSFEDARRKLLGFDKHQPPPIDERY